MFIEIVEHVEDPLLPVSKEKKRKQDKKKFTCDICEYSTKYFILYKTHMKVKHKKAILSYTSKYIATTGDNLKHHIESKQHIVKSKHEGVRYPCNKCEYAATTASNIKRHIEIKHEGVRYPCVKCEYAATTACNLKQHIQNKHKGVRYHCL